MPLSPKELSAVLKDLLSERPKHLLVYSAAWALMRAVDAPFQKIPELLLDSLQAELPADCTMLMPTFTKGYRNGALDLDNEPGTTGVLNELFRRQPGVCRTTSAFFSYAASGPQAASLVRARPIDAWGDGSVLDWAFRVDAGVLLLGAGWEACSFKHRVEWLERVPYRSRKVFRGRIRSMGAEMDLEETLFVRGLTPPVENKWPHNERELYLKKGALERIESGAFFAFGRARQIENCLRPLVRVDPYALVAEPEKIRAAYPIHKV